MRSAAAVSSDSRQAPPSTRSGAGRIKYIDGLRGLAIAMVILYHSYSRWPESYPYGDKFVGSYLTDTKVVGVQLFFIISGFVILMTLSAASRFTTFLYRRWLRLFPAMVVCSAIVLATVDFFPERPGGALAPTDLIPGLSLLGEHVVNFVTRNAFSVKSLEGSFWSLYVEFRFYLFFGFMYFFIGRRAAIASLLAAYVLYQISVVTTEVGSSLYVAAAAEFDGKVHLRKLLSFFGFEYYIWFFAGALYFEYLRSERRWLLAVAAISSVVGALASSQPLAADIFICLVFFAASTSSFVRGILSTPVLQVIGFVSYPLYLIHENMVVATIVKVGRIAPWMPPVLVPILPIALTVAIAFVVARWVEPVAKSVVRRSIETAARAI
ncbi:acyltransferase family protein [Pinisolibacter sp.]|uniref:acyltransferase family protein n=1 Tax=Pinisolibacter sp. TaxID=2172024 RepID=UPI002FDEEB28